MIEQETGAHQRAEEAAAEWRVRLDDDASVENRTGFERWLSADAGHVAAFQRVDALWAGLSVAAPRYRARRRVRQGGAVLGFGLAIFGATLFLRDPAYQTGRGERETVVLEDGSRLTLNTDSRVVIDYDQDVRHVSLTRGEVFFDVAHNAQRPFIVRVNDESVRVLGTSFVVRRDGPDMQVALVSGSVVVAEGGDAGLAAAPVTLVPGERVRHEGERAAVIDRPKLDNLLAWRRGELVLDRTVVASAVSEMNRYSHLRIIVADPTAARARITGVFKTGETEAFARTLARLYGLKIERRSDALVLSARQAR